MTESRCNIILTKKEKELLKRIAVKNDLTITDYIKSRIFNNNPDVASDAFIYECPARSKHNYLTVGILQDIYYLLLHVIAKDNDLDEVEKIKSLTRELAKKSLANYGYLKINNED